jgi:glycosyltransferase involved in cell wall biosynthesis
VNVPDVSVIIPTRDRCRQLQISLGSAIAQRDVDLEIVIVDDGSRDATERTVSAIADPRVRYLRRAGSPGVSAARNAGIAEARGRWIAFLDDDDVWAPEKLARQTAVTTASGRRWSYVGDVLIDADLRIFAGSPPPPPDEVIRSLEQHDSVPGGASSVVVRADALSEAGPFDPELTNSEDWDMWIRLARRGPPDWVCKPLVAVSHHQHNASRDMASMIRQLDVVAARYSIQVDRARHFRWAAWHALVEGRRIGASRYYAHAVMAGDVTSLGRAAVALMRPRYAIRRGRWGAPANLRDPWIAEAQTWLEALASAEGTPCGPT